MKSREFIALLEKYSRGECNPAEEKLIHDWYENIGTGHAHQERAHDDIEADLWSKINPQPTARPAHFPTYLLKAAATFAILALAGLGLYIFWDNSAVAENILAIKERIVQNGTDNVYTTITNNGKDSKSITLADGSLVTLKSDSEIRFAKNFTPEEREVYLTGEAFFNVKRDERRPFLVYSNEVITRVLGTSFNVRAYENDREIIVAVKSGKVSVYAKTSEEYLSRAAEQRPVILTPNQQVVFNRESEQVSKQLVEHPEIVLPKPTLFMMKYDGTPVTKIFEALEQNYGIDISYDEEILTGCVLTTTMSDEGLYERIEVICRAINAEYMINNAVIVIRSHGCL